MAGRTYGEVSAGTCRREDTSPGIWTLCSGQCVQERGKAKGIRFPWYDFLLWQNPLCFIQGETENVAQETTTITGSVYRLDTEVSQLAVHRRAAPAGKGPRHWTLKLLAIMDNSDECHLYMHLTTRALFKWLNRRSQRKSYTWDGFHHALQHVGWPTPRIRVDMNPFSPRPNV